VIRLRRSRLRTDIHANFHGEKKRTLEKELLINQRRIRRGEIQKHTFNNNHCQRKNNSLPRQAANVLIAKPRCQWLPSEMLSIIVPKISIGGSPIAMTIISFHVNFVIRSSRKMLSRSKIEKCDAQ